MSGTSSLAFFDEFHRFSSSLESSVTSSLSNCKQIKESAITSRAQLYAPPKVDEATRARQKEKQEEVWQTLIGNAEKLKEEVTQLLAALTVNAPSQNAAVQKQHQQQQSQQPLATVYASFSNQLAAMQQQSAALRQSLADQEESRASLLTARRSAISQRKSALAEAAAALAKEAPTAVVGDEENSPQLSNKVAPAAVVAPVSKQSTTMSPVAPATKPKRKSVLPSARTSPLKAVAVPPVSKISPAKLAQVMRRQSLEARKAAEAQQAAELEAARAAAEAEAENAAEQSAVMEDVMEEKTAEVITAQTTLDTSIINSPEQAVQTSMIASPSPVAPSVAAAPTTPATKQQLVGLSDDLLDSPATPDFVGKLSEATRRMLDAHAGVSASVTSAGTSSSIPAGSSSVAPRSTVSGASSSIPILSRPTMPLVDSPATPELATVALAKETRAAKKAGLINTPATGRKMSLGGGRESLGGNALPTYPSSSQTARTPAPVTPARNLFHSVATPMSARVRGINARQSSIGLATPSANIVPSSLLAPTTPAASSSSTSTAAPEILPPVHYSMLAPAAPGAGLDDSNLMSNSMSMSDSLLATPELASRKSVAGSVAWVSGAESAKKKSKPVLGRTPPKAASVTSPSTAPVTTTPRSARKGILKTPKSSVRKSSRIAEKTPTSAVKGLAPSNSDPTLATTAAAGAVPGTPASPILGSILSSLSESFSMPSPAPAAAPSSAMKDTPASAAKRRAASAK